MNRALLTSDDFPSANTPAIVDYLGEKGIQVIFFCTGQNLERKFRPFRFPFGDKGGANKEALQKHLEEKGFHKVDDRHITYPWWKENNLNTDIDTFWTFDFAEYNIRPDSDFTKESVWNRMHDTNPNSGAVLFGKNNRHILLLHAHDETEEMLPEYYKLFIEHLLEHGVVFDAPGFL